ncbi:thioredoxin TrxC [Roseococcus sp. SDR]|uniref:thioredoxin TrxC n=1 Tax=Roseococcus sp. SDR TaxID=2835532 RepID=UPI001BD10EC1|nr:thioredoxin TrxC [Roseococcus sp. SDR]MBS7791624.1 thioredoxin TrxC [Roseococcus sp. SDR]MBV1846938.1 thioredoxin TrxC [Roseococcus sp. SDR]
MSDALQIICPGCGAVNRVPAARLADDPRCGQCKAALFQGKPLALDEEGFRRHLRLSGVPLLVDFWAAWCGPCRVMAPEFEAAARLLEPRLRLVKIDTEQAPALSAELQIRSIPTLALFAGGREVARQAGAMRARDIAAWAERALAAHPP